MDGWMDGWMDEWMEQRAPASLANQLRHNIRTRIIRDPQLPLRMRWPTKTFYDFIGFAVAKGMTVRFVNRFTYKTCIEIMLILFLALL